MKECLRQILALDGSEAAYCRHIRSALNAARDDGELEEGRVSNGALTVHLIGPADGSVTRRKDEISADREARKQRELNVE